MAVMKKAESAAHTAYDALMTAKKEVDAFAKASNARLKKSGELRVEIAQMKDDPASEG